VTLLIFGALPLAASSLIAGVSLRFGSWPPLLLAGALFAYAQIVLAALLLSPLHAVGRSGWLIVEIVVLAIAALAWQYAGRPAPPSRPAAVWGDPDLRAVSPILVVAVAAIVLQLVVGTTTAPSNWDSMTYHLSRAAYWLQSGSIGWYDGGSVRQLASAPNGEIALAWTMAMSGRDAFASLVQWFALIAGALGVWIVSRELGFDRRGCAFAAAVWCVLPAPIIQATTTQNDVVLSGCVLATIAFGLRALRGGRLADALACAIAAGLGAGTKGSFLLALPSLAIVLAAAVRQLRPSRRTVMRLLTISLAAFAVLGSSRYVENTVRVGGPFGGLKEIGERQGPVPENVARVAWSLVEAPGIQIPWVDNLFRETARSWAKSWETPAFAFTLGTGVSEDEVVAGLVGMLVLPGLVFFLLLARRTPPIQRALAAGAVLFVLLFGAAHRSTPFNGRILLIGVAMAVPLVGAIASRASAKGAVTALAIASLLPSLFANASKPLLTPEGQPSVWQMDRAEQMSVSRHAIAPFIRVVDRRFPAGSRLGFIGGEDSWDYPLFGARRQRTVKRFALHEAQVHAVGFCGWIVQMMHRDRLEAIIIAQADAQVEVPEPSRQRRILQPAPGYFIVRRGLHCG
jgi:hypothetical protein